MYMIRGGSYRKKLRSGDVFVINYPRDMVVPVLVARARPCVEDPVLANFLVYVYNMVQNCSVSALNLDRANLMFPPMVINRLGWSWGYFEKIEFDRDLAMSFVMEEHSFACRISSSAPCINEWRQPVACGPDTLSYSVGNANFLDVMIAARMGWDKELAGRHP